MGKQTILTREGFEKLRQELEYLEKVERKRISQQIAEAREKGDLSENAEYDAAKEAQGMLEMKIAKLQEIIANARIVDETQLNTDEVRQFTTVTIRDIKTSKEFTYTLVSESEANTKDGKISITSPLGKGILGKKVGEIADIEVPAGKMRFQIVQIKPM